MEIEGPMLLTRLQPAQPGCQPSAAIGQGAQTAQPHGPSSPGCLCPSQTAGFLSVGTGTALKDTDELRSPAGTPNNFVNATRKEYRRPTQWRSTVNI